MIHIPKSLYDSFVLKPMFNKIPYKYVIKHNDICLLVIDRFYGYFKSGHIQYTLNTKLNGEFQ